MGKVPTCLYRARLRPTGCSKHEPLHRLSTITIEALPSSLVLDMAAYGLKLEQVTHSYASKRNACVQSGCHIIVDHHCYLPTASTIPSFSTYDGRSSPPHISGAREYPGSVSSCQCFSTTCARYSSMERKRGRSWRMASSRRPSSGPRGVYGCRSRGESGRCATRCPRLRWVSAGMYSHHSQHRWQNQLTAMIGIGERVWTGGCC